MCKEIRSLELTNTELYKKFSIETRCSEEDLQKYFLEYCSEPDNDSSPSASAIFISNDKVDRSHYKTVTYRLHSSLAAYNQLMEIGVDFGCAGSIPELLYCFLKLACFIAEPVDIAGDNKIVAYVLVSAYELGACRVPIEESRVICKVLDKVNDATSENDVMIIIGYLDTIGVINCNDGYIEINEYIRIEYQEGNDD